MAIPNDVILIYLEDTPVSFARVEDINPDVKKNWYHVKLLMLQIPLQVVTWILKDDYIAGEEFFMGGKRMRLEKVICPGEDEIVQAGQTLENADRKTKDFEKASGNQDMDSSSKIISFAQMKKMKEKNGPER